MPCRLFTVSALLLIVFLTRTAAALPEPTLVGVTPGAGPTSGGTTLTITITEGSYICAFDPCLGPVLLIGGIPVVYTTPGPTTLIAVTPPHAAGAVDIELRPGTGQTGTPSTLSNAFLYQGNGIPTLSAAVAALLVLAIGVAGVIVLRPS